jgi:hypothetical protein
MKINRAAAISMDMMGQGETLQIPDIVYNR